MLVRWMRLSILIGNELNMPNELVQGISSSNFCEFPLRSEILKSLKHVSYMEMTSIQQSSLPSILKKSDVLAQAKTGSGKTCCFAIGILQSLKPDSKQIEGLVLCATRELADQVSAEIRRLACFLPNIKVLTIYGGVPIFPQIKSLRHGAYVIVGTPGRVQDLLRKGVLDLSSVKVSVLDEADRMLDMGFAESIFTIYKYLQGEVQNLLFSATYSDDIKAMSKRLLKDPVAINIGPAETNTKLINQCFIKLEPTRKLPALRSILLQEQPERCLVFCNTIEQCEHVCRYLKMEGFAATSLHGKKEQKLRTGTLVTFSNGSHNVLVVTDVASRGLDIKGLNLVVNFDMTRDPEVFVHRIGRTGRHETVGKVWTFVTASEGYKIKKIEDMLGFSCNYVGLPKEEGFLLPRKPLNKTLQINLGKKTKIRPGDILGALTSSQEIAATLVGKIDVLSHESYVAIHKSEASKAKLILENSPIKKLKAKTRWFNP